MYQRNVLGQDDIFIATTPDSQVVDYNAYDSNAVVYTDLPIDYSNFPVVTSPTFSMPPSQPASQPSSSWSWTDILSAGASAFAKIYPVIKGTDYPSPYPQTPTTQVPPGYKFNPTTGRIEPLTAQIGLTASPYFWPVVLGGAAFLLMSKRK